MPKFFPSAKSDPELYPYRSGLVFGFFNALTWQIAIGTPMVLFAEALGAGPAAVGLAYSFVYLLTPVQILSTALVPRYGFKKVSMAGWGGRSLFMIVPVALTMIAPALGVKGWMVSALIWSVFFFCLTRAMGASAITGWLYALLPAKVRGRYFANDQMFSGIAGVLTLISCSALFAFLPIFTALLVQYAVALLGSTLSLIALNKLPDAEKPQAESVASVVKATPQHMFGAGKFRTYLWLAVGYGVVSTPIPPFAAYFLKVSGGFTPGAIMAGEVLRYLGVVTAAWAIRTRIDRTGARPFLLLSLILYTLVALYWVLFLRTSFGGFAGVYAAYYVLGLGATCWAVANLHYLPQVVQEEKRTLMVAIHGAVTACIGGCSPIVWGWFLKTDAGSGPAINLPVFQIFFLFVIVGTALLSSRVARLHEDTSLPVEPLVIGNAVLRPFRAATYLVSLIDINRSAQKQSAAEASNKEVS